MTEVELPTRTSRETSPGSQIRPWSIIPVHHQAQNLPIEGGVSFTMAVTVTDRAAMDLQLEAAVASVQAEAMVRRSGGILVTRHGSNTFTVKISEAVPFGLTREKHDW